MQKLVENVRQNVTKQRRPDSQYLSDWLFNAFIDSSHTCSDKRFRGSTNILQQLPHDSIHVSFIVSLYSDEKGYSITLCPQGREGQTNLKQMFLPYEDNEIFSYLDNGEIPPVVLEVLEKTQYCFLYDGCMFCKVVNYRDCINASSQETTLLLLRPTAESMLSAVNNVAKEKSFSQEERFQIESKLLVATQPPLCLDPNIEVACITNRLQYNRRKLHTPSMKRYLRRRSQAARARTHLYSTRPAPKSLMLHSFVTRRKDEKGALSGSDKPRPNSADSWKHRGKKPLAPPCTTEELSKAVANLARSLIPPEAAILKPKPVMDTAPQPKTAAGQNAAAVAASGTPAQSVEVNQLLEEPKPEQAKLPLQPTATQPAVPNPLKRPHSTITPTTGPKLRPLLPTTEATRRLVRERALSQVSSDLQKPRPIMPSLNPVSGQGSAAVRGPRPPSTVFVQPVSSTALPSTKPMLRPGAASSIQLPPVQLLVSGMGSTSNTPRPPSMSTSTAKLIPKLHNPNPPSSVQLANLPKLTHIAQGAQSAPSLPQKATPIKQISSAPSMPQLHKMPAPSTHTQKP